MRDSKITAAVAGLSGISVLGAVWILGNFHEITARIAIWTADFLSSGFPVLLIVLAVVYFVLKLKWKMYRRFVGW